MANLAQKVQLGLDKYREMKNIYDHVKWNLFDDDGDEGWSTQVESNVVSLYEHGSEIGSKAVVIMSRNINDVHDVIKIFLEKNKNISYMDILYRNNNEQRFKITRIE